MKYIPTTKRLQVFFLLLPPTLPSYLVFFHIYIELAVFITLLWSPLNEVGFLYSIHSLLAKPLPRIQYIHFICIGPPAGPTEPVALNPHYSQISRKSVTLCGVRYVYTVQYSEDAKSRVHFRIGGAPPATFW